MNEARQRLKLWDLPAMDSRVRSPDVTYGEMILGYFLGPFLVLAMTTVISTYYLTFYRTYDDILRRAPSFLVLLPLLSVIPMALANITVGIIIGRTQTRQGKARPLLFMAAPLLLLSGLVMFLIPYLSLGFRLACGRQIGQTEFHGPRLFPLGDRKRRLPASPGRYPDSADRAGGEGAFVRPRGIYHDGVLCRRA